MRKAAARLGLGLAAASAREKISSSLFVRRSSAFAKKKGMTSETEKILYLCFREKSLYCVNQVVRPLNYIEEEFLPEAVYKTSEDVGEWRFSGRFGSQILFPFGRRHINRVDTTSWPIEFENFTTEFSSPKVDPVVVELNGKLYCIDKDNPSRPFEVLDLEDDDCKWRPLAKPPFPRKRSWRPFYTSVLQESNKILAWEKGEIGVYCFDVTKPENGWKQSPFSLGNGLPFLSGCTGTGRPPIFIHNHHPDLGDCYLILDYDYHGAPFLVSPFFMSHSCESFQRIRFDPIRLPKEFCSKYLKPFDIHTDCEFVHLGGQKFCLVFNRFFADKNTGMLLLITFEYDLVKHSSPPLKIETKLLWTRHIRYHSKQLHKRAADKKIYSLRLTGAFAL